jgi:excisionase family DNA binding protein
MAEYLTTRQLQDILQVDRTTIYRMADSGRVPAVKVGSQWRFPRLQIEMWLKTRNGAYVASSEDEVPSRNGNLSQLLPVDCVQIIQDTFADALGVMILITDLEGNPITQPSNPCGLYQATDGAPSARKRCMQLWAQLARDPSLQPAFIPSHIGLLCARGLIRVGSELRAMVVVGGIAPPTWPPDQKKIVEIARYLGIESAVIQEHIDEVFYVEPDDQERMIGFVQRIADIVAHIITERNQLFEKLNNIAELTKL